MEYRGVVDEVKKVIIIWFMPIIVSEDMGIDMPVDVDIGMSVPVAMGMSVMDIDIESMFILMLVLCCGDGLTTAAFFV
jgi:hypothetical protein